MPRLTRNQWGHVRGDGAVLGMFTVDRAGVSCSVSRFDIDAGEATGAPWGSSVTDTLTVTEEISP